MKNGNEYPLEDLAEEMANGSIFYIMVVSVISGNISRSAAIKLILNQSNIIAREKRKTTGRLRIEKLVENAFDIARIKIEMNIDNELEDIKMEHGVHIRQAIGN